jgi:hypothetical protein
MKIQSRSLFAVWLISLAAFIPAKASAAWFDSDWHYRRAVQMDRLIKAFDGHLLCQVEFYTDGHALPNGEDVRVATEEGKLVPSHVLMAGPGDRMRVVFEPKKDIFDYAIYFGNPNPAPPPAGLGDVKYVGGLMLESRQWTGGVVRNFETIEKSWLRSKPLLGQIMIDRPFIGFNPFGDQEQWISKMTGNLLAPLDGDYTLAMAVDDEGGFYIDGKPTLFAHLGGGDIRYHTTVHLTKGWHDFVLYHVNFADGAYVSVGWRRPISPKVELIESQFFGTCLDTPAGPMEEHNKVLVADFLSSHQGECFLDDGYSFRYHFSARAKAGLPTKVRWDFGDGQTSTEPEVDHVYLHENIYTVKLTAHAGSNEDVQSNRVVIGRDYAHIIDTHEDTPATESEIVSRYDLNTMPVDVLARVVRLHLLAGRLDAAVTAATRLASEPTHGDSAASLKVLLDVQQQLIDANRADAALSIWEHVPKSSSLQPDAALHAATLAMWWVGDFTKAANLLQPYQSQSDEGSRRLYGQALLLSGHVDQGQKILEGLASQMSPARKAALSGAAARSVEYFITEKETDAGEEAWTRWMTRFPDDFLEGYSVVLRTKLMELRQCQPAAARLAEAFAAAEPKSSYAPQLLDRASKLLATSDPAKSAALHELLKQKYPEDPLSQN